jgi:hypothetical protein
MPAHDHHVEQGGAALCVTGQEAGAQRVARELGAIQTHALGVRFDGVGD